MVDVPSLADRLAPDTIQRLERAAEKRYEEGEYLRKQNRLLAAVYLYGYSVEMCLAAAYFRSAGFDATQPIDKDERARRMAQARKERLMSTDPHPLDGWARFLEWQRVSCGNLASGDRNRLQEAVAKAKTVYTHWRPALRYKVTSVMPTQLNEVRLCVHWFIKQRGRL